MATPSSTDATFQQEERNIYLEAWECMSVHITPGDEARPTRPCRPTEPSLMDKLLAKTPRQIDIAEPGRKASQDISLKIFLGGSAWS